jgi:hypothetical protein
MELLPFIPVMWYITCMSNPTPDPEKKQGLSDTLPAKMDLSKRIETFARQARQELGVTDYVTLYQEMAKEMQIFADDVEAEEIKREKAFDASLELEAQWIKERNEKEKAAAGLERADVQTFERTAEERAAIVERHRNWNTGDRN